jgi:hypothetical protein
VEDVGERNKSHIFYRDFNSGTFHEGPNAKRDGWTVSYNHEVKVLGFWILVPLLLMHCCHFRATKVREYFRRGHDNWTHSCVIYCDECFKELRNRSRDDPILTFRIYCRQKDGKPEFTVHACSLCRHAQQIWQISEMPGSRRFRFYVDATAQSQKLNSSENVVRNCQIIRPIGKWVRDMDAMSAGERHWFDMSCTPETTRRRHVAAEKHTTSLKEFIASLPGDKVVRVGQSPRSDYTYKFNETERDVISITSIAAWAVSAWKEADYIQLDCSFRGIKPYAYCVPHAIIGVEAIPLGNDAFGNRKHL